MSNLGEFLVVWPNGAKDSDDDQNAGKMSKKKQRAMLTRIERDHGTCKIPVAVNEVSIKLQTLRPTKHIKAQILAFRRQTSSARCKIACQLQS